MKPLSTLKALAVSGLLIASALPAAAEVSEAEAARLQAIGETYFGKPRAGETSVVRVAIEGDHYRASLDVALLVRRLLALAPDEQTKKVTIDWAAPSFALVQRPDGLWRFWDHRVPKLVFEVDGQRTELTTDGIDFEGLTDPTTGASPMMKGRFGRISATSTIKKPDEPLSIVSENTSADVVFDGSSKPGAAPGSLDATVRETTGSMLYALDISGGMAGGVPDMRLALTGGKQEQTSTIKGIRHAAILDLWAGLVSSSDLVVNQGALKAKISAALPVLDEMTHETVARDFSFESPFGIAKAEKATIGFDVAGLVRDGRFAMNVGLSGFQAYSLFMPKWAQKLIPTETALAGKVTGYDLATPMALYLDKADFQATPPLKPEDEAQIAALFLPRGGVEIVLDGNRLVGPLYTLTADGRLTAGPSGAKGAITVKATGIDKVAEHLAQPGGDEYSKAFAATLAMARQFAERKGDDLVWRFDFDGDVVAVNGKPLK